MSELSLALAPKLREMARGNPVKFGSFGEYVFVSVAQSRDLEVVRRHLGEVDFVVDGCPVDVKSTTKSIEKLSALVPVQTWGGRRRDGVRYARVEFFRDGVRVALERDVWGDVVEWKELVHLYGRWSVQHTPRSTGRDPSSQAELFAPFKEEVEQACREHGRDSKVIQRTCVHGESSFGIKNPPDNMDSRRREGRDHVFISFVKEIRRDRIAAVFAIPDEDLDQVPRLAVDGLSKGKPKIDLEALGDEYVYRSLKDFRDRYFRTHGFKRSEE